MPFDSIKFRMIKHIKELELKIKKVEADIKLKQDK